jgi:hypothetical protein
MKLESVEVINDFESGEIMYEMTTWETDDHHVKLLEIRDSHDHLISKSYKLDFSDLKHKMCQMVATQIHLHKVE